MRFVPSSPAGLRVEIRFKIDKKKIEFYFSLIKKNFLTKKRNARVRGKTENIAAVEFTATGWRPNRVPAALT